MISTSTQPSAVGDAAFELARHLLEVLPHVGMAVAHAARGTEHPDPRHLHQIYMLRALDRGACSFRQLMTERRVSAPTLSRSIDALVKRGWVERDENPEDRRQVMLTLTGAGRHAFDAMRARTLTEIAASLAPLTDAQRNTIAHALTILDDVFTHTNPPTPLT